MLLIGITLIRIPFLSLTFQKNNLGLADLFYEYYLMQKPISLHSKSVTRGKQLILINPNEPMRDIGLPEIKAVFEAEQRITLKLTLRKCVNITFIELLKDIPILIMSLFTVVLFPWRVISVIRVWHESLARIP